MNNFSLRAISGFFFVAVVLTAINYLPALGLLCLLVAGMGVYELGRMFQVRLFYLGGFILATLSSLFVFMFRTIDGGVIPADLIWRITLIFGLLAALALGSLGPQKSIIIVLGSLYLLIGTFTFFQAGILHLTDKASMNHAYLVLIATWSNDVFAYLIGRKIGKTKLIPSVSPNKTWEGTIGGLLFAALAACITGYFSEHAWNYILLIQGVFIGVAATAGDLIESKMKRMAGVKDSGNIIPGHGGILDRFDATLLTMPLYLLTYYFLK